MGTDVDDAATGLTPVRNLAMDFYRLAAIVLVVLGHWLLAALTYSGGQFDMQRPLTALPWTQWLTRTFQVVPVFFVVAGYASAGSRIRWQRSGTGRQAWLRHRLARIAGPTTVYVIVVLAIVGGLEGIGVNGSALAFGGWAVGTQL